MIIEMINTEKTENLVPIRNEITNSELDFENLQKKYNRLKAFYDAIILTSPDIAVIIRLNDGKIIEVNKSFERNTGYLAKEICGKSSSEFCMWYNEEDRETFLKRLIEEKEINNFETVFRLKNGELRNGLISAKVIEFENEIYNYSVIKDITDYKKHAEELRIAKEKAEKSDKLKSEFLAQMSHEIRTPVNTILSFSSLLENELGDVIPENMRFGFKMIDNGGRRLIRTIELILNVSELHTGTYRCCKKYLDLRGDILNPIINEFGNLVAEKGLELEFKAESDIDTIIYADQYTVTQLYLNLIDNAIKYTKTGKIKVTLNVNSEEHLYSEVEDSGIGISEEFMKILYVPFTQEESGYTRKYEGTGLGLAMVKKCCEINNIDIKVRSTKGKGTKFTLIYE